MSQFETSAASPPGSPVQHSEELLLLVVTCREKGAVSEFEAQYSTHSSRCVFAKMLESDDPAVHAKLQLPASCVAELRRFSGCSTTPEFDSWMSSAINTNHRMVFNVSDWFYFAFVSPATGEVLPYVAEDAQSYSSTAPNTPGGRISEGSGSSSSSGHSTPVKKPSHGTKRRTQADVEDEEEDATPWMSIATMGSPARLRNAVSNLRKKITKLQL